MRTLSKVAFCFDFKVRRQSVTLQSGCQSKSQNDDFEYFQVDFDKATFEFDWILESLPGTNLGSSQRVAKR